ncbi:MAG: thioredoxin family protein [Tumebacillaceae bacterium]
MSYRKKKGSNNRMTIIFGVVLLVIVGLIAFGALSKNYDKTAEANSDLYKNEISLEQLKTKIDGKEDFYAYFYQTGCEHCKVVSPILIPLAEGLNKPLKPVNIYQKQEPWKEYNISGTPTVVHFKDGKEVKRIVGEHPEADFRNFLNE